MNRSGHGPSSTGFGVGSGSFTSVCSGASVLVVPSAGADSSLGDSGQSKVTRCVTLSF